MYGLLIQSIVTLIKVKYGEEIWELVRRKAKLDTQTFSTHQTYSETYISKIAKCLAEVTGENQEYLMELMGQDFVNFIGNYGYDRYLRVLGRHLRDFLNGLDNLHEYMKSSYPKLKAPSFYVEQENATGLTLHYRTKRKGFVNYVKGLIKAVGLNFYQKEMDVEVVLEKMEGDRFHVIFELKFDNRQFHDTTSSVSIFSQTRSNSQRQRAVDIFKDIKGEVFFSIFPFHIIFKSNMLITSIGESLKQVLKNVENDSIVDVFNLIRPPISFTWDNVIESLNNVFEISTIEPIKLNEFDEEDAAYGTKEDDDENGTETGTDVSTTRGKVDNNCLCLRGQMYHIKDFDCIVFLPAPVLSSLDKMSKYGFYINDLSLYDYSRELVVVGSQQQAELKLALDQQRTKSKALAESMKKLDDEKRRADDLLHRLLPKKVAECVRDGTSLMNLCETFTQCTILFSDIVEFTSTCSHLSPIEVVTLLNEMFTRFDGCLERFNCYKVETIGDAYMIASGVPERFDRHSLETVNMGFAMLNEIDQMINPVTRESMKIRIGCHSGAVVAGIVGLKMPRYCLFGESVQIANKMEATSQIMRIHVSEKTKDLLDANKFIFKERGRLQLASSGSELKTFIIEGRHNGREMEYPFSHVSSVEFDAKDHGAKWEGFKLNSLS